jgi:MFS family permease
MFKGINTVVKILVVADFFTHTALGTVTPVFAIFITGSIAGGSARVAGFAIAIYWIVKSIAQLPIAKFLDASEGEATDFWALFVSTLAGGTIILGYLFANTPLHIYLIQAAFGLTMAFGVPARYSIFTRHVDRWRIGFEWSLESVFSVGLATALAAALGGYVADTFGFEALFLISGFIFIFSGLVQLGLRRHLLPMKNVPVVVREKPHHLR